MKIVENMVRSGMSLEEVMKNGEVRLPQCEFSMPLETTPCPDDEIVTGTDV